MFCAIARNLHLLSLRIVRRCKVMEYGGAMERVAFQVPPRQKTKFSRSTHG